MDETEEKERRMFVFIIAVACLAAILCLSAACHRHVLRKEAGLLKPPGTMVEVNGHSLHVYAEGGKGHGPVLVFLSGSGTPAPVFDFEKLYRLLSKECRIAVVEKVGYGYSRYCGSSRDLDNMLFETREALKKSGERGPFVLFPHSMSGLEALYWAVKYPEEICGIVGLDNGGSRCIPQ